MPKRNASDIIDIRGLLKTYLSKWYLFVISVVVCLAVALLAIRVFKDKYAVKANVLIQTEETNPLSTATAAFGDLLGTKGEVDDEIFVISSHSLYREAVKDLGLNKLHYVKKGFLNNVLTYPKYPIDVTTSANVADTLRPTLTFKVSVDKKGLADINVKGPDGKLAKAKDVKLPYTVKTQYGEFTIGKTQYFPQNNDVTSKILFTGYHSAAEDFAKYITSDIASKKSNVIQLGYVTPNPALGEALLGTIIEKYNQRGMLEKNMQGEATAKFIEDRLSLLQVDMKQLEDDIRKFKLNLGVADLYQEMLYQTKKRGAIDEQLIAAEAQQEVLRMTRDFITGDRNKYALIPLTVDSESLQEIIGKYNDLIIERQEMLKTVNENNVAVKRLSDRIDAMRSNLLSSVDKNYKQMSSGVDELKKQLGGSMSVIGDYPNQEVAIGETYRQNTVKHELYVFLLKRLEENAVMMSNNLPKGTIVDEPYTLKKPLGMGKKMILLLAFIFGLCIPPVYLYVLKLIRNRVETRSEIESRTAAPILGEMCVDHSGRDLVVSPTDTSSATELFRLIRANLLFVLNDENDKVVLLTSSTSGEGKSFISINLAATLALLGKKVLLIGMDIRAPKLAQYLNISGAKGLTQYLSSSNISLKEIINHNAAPDIPTLDVIVAGPVPPNPAEMLISKKVDQMFATLREEYDYIIVDSAPVGLVSDTFSLDRVADATIYVARVNHTTASDIDYIDEIYEEGRLKKLSVVVNGVKTKKQYGYGNKKK